MVKNSQAASPVISPQISTASTVFSKVKTKVNQRLDKAVSGFNTMPHIIAAGRASTPRADISNPLVASVAEYSPLSGSRPANHMRLDVQNTPASKVDNVADAIQRYLGVSPRREPTADPLDEATVARHPQQLTQSADRWADARYYQFSANGLESYQFQPEFRAWGGGLKLNIAGQGQTDISAPAHRSPLGVEGLGNGEAEAEVVFAAQKAMASIKERQGEPVELAKVGAPIYDQDPYFSPAYAAQNAMGRIRSMMENPYTIVVESGGQPQNYGPTQAFQTAMANSQQALEKKVPSVLKVGAPLSTEDALASPSKAWATATNVNKGLEAARFYSGDDSDLARFYRPRGMDEAYHRAIRIMEEMEVGVMRPVVNTLSSRT